MHLQHDEWHRPEVYLAEYTDYLGAEGMCIFNNALSAIYYVMTGLGNSINWKNFPDPTKNFPFEDRNGNEYPHLNPLFIVTPRKIGDVLVSGKVTKMAVAEHWVVGNGAAMETATNFNLVTGYSVTLTGSDDSLQGKV